MQSNIDKRLTDAEKRIKWFEQVIARWQEEENDWKEAEASLHAENARLRNLVGSLISETNGCKSYARLCVLGWACVYCKHLWNDDGPEHHADDCPVVIGRAEMAEEG